MTAFTAYVLIPVYILSFAINSDWFRTNFSVLGNIAGRKEAFVLWGLIVGIYFFFYSPENYPPYAPKADSQLAGLSCSGAVGLCCYHALSSRADALKGQSPHCLCFSCCCLSDHLPVFHCAPTVPDCGTKKQNHLPVVSGRAGSHCADSGFLFVLAGIVSSALEIFFTVSATLMAYRLYLRVCPRP